MKKSIKKLLTLFAVLFFSASPLYVKAAGNGLDFSCTSKTVKAKFSCDTLKIIEKHLYDFDATNFNSKIASYGGFENYAKSVGGIFGQYYGKKIEGRTEKDFQTAAEYVLGWMYMYGWDYMNSSGSHTSCSGKDCFYSNGGFSGKYSDSNFDHVISGKDGGSGHMSSECGDLEVFTYNKLGISRNKQLPKVTKLRDLKVGDAVYFFNHKVNKTNESDWGIGRHNVIVGEVYSDHLVFYDTGPVYPSSRNYKKIIYFPNEASGETDMDAIRKEYPHYDKNVDWGMRRFYDFKSSSLVGGKGNSGVSNNSKFYCEFCTKSEDDPLYKKEKQFYEKIKIIKSIFGDRIDEVALAATVLHKYGDNYTYNVEYTEDFNSDSYSSMWSEMSSSIGSSLTKLLISEEDKSKIDANEKIDLLTIAAIVMVDSNNGQYSDVCYRDGLAGNGLVGNTKDNDAFAALENGVFCGIYETAVTIDTPLNFVSRLFSNDSFLVAGISSANRAINTKKVCDNGYVGGLYDNVYNVKKETQKEALKKKTAQDIIDFSNYYKRIYGTLEEEKDYSCTVNIAGSTGDFASWKQADSNWGNIPLGESNSVRNAGCLVTSISMQIARSGTKIGKLPSGYSEFNPGAFVTSLNDNNGFSGGGNFGWRGFNKIAPNWGVGDFVELGVSDNKELALAVSKELSTGFGSENYQKFLVLQIHHSKSSQHWVAVNGVSNDEVTIFDPGGPSGTTLDQNYNNWVVDGYRVMYAKDVPFGQTGTSSNNECTGASVVTGEKGQGNIKIPEEYSSKGVFTITEIDKISWAYDSGELYDKWLASGAKYSNGIAVMNGRFLIACTNTFGKVGDEIDFFLDDGTKIPTIMFDTKDQTYAHGTPANKWGHYDGGYWNVLEFEVDSYYYHKKYGKETNPGTGANDWYREWAGKRVASATNVSNGGTSSSSTTSTGTTNTGSSVTGYDLARLAVDVAVTAWPTPRVETGDPNKRPTIKEAEPYLKVHDAVWPKLIATGTFGTHSPYYASCGPAAIKVIHYSGADTTIPHHNPKYLIEHFESSPLWEEVKVDTSKTYAEVCQPGDVAVSTLENYHHVMIYVGKELCRTRFPNCTGGMWEAAEQKTQLPGITPREHDKVSRFKFKIFRLVANESSSSAEGETCVNGEAISSGTSETGGKVKVVCGKSGETTNVLFVGNSKTSVDNIPDKFKKIAEANGYKVKVSVATQDAMPLLYMSEHYTDTINKKYDCVVMQEQTDSYMSSDVSNFLSGAKNISDMVRKNNSSVLTYVRQTWSIKDDANIKLAFSNAEEVADKTQSHLILDGKAFQKSLESGIEVFRTGDNIHQNTSGAYLSAACIYNTLYGRTSSGTSYKAGLGSKAGDLQDIADGICKAPETGGSSGDKIARLAVRMAGTASPDKAIVNTSGDHKGKVKDARLDDFYKIMHETIGKYPSHDTSNPNSTGEGYNNYALSSCVQAAAGVIRATVDPDISSGDQNTMMRYLKNNPEKWTMIKHLKPSDNLDKECQPGDLLVSNGHVAIYVGNNIAREKFANTDGNVYEASYHSASNGTYPRISRYKKSTFDFYIYRPTGKGTFTYPFIDVEKVLAG